VNRVVTRIVSQKKFPKRWGKPAGLPRHPGRDVTFLEISFKKQFKGICFALVIVPLALVGCAYPQRNAESSADARAQYALATQSAKQGDYATAAVWLRKSAEGGFAYAQTELGSYYARGHGVTRDYTKALCWYRQAAAQGDPLAQYCIGYAYAQGDGVAQNRDKAVNWWRKAAERGQVEAQNALGQFYFQGNGDQKRIDYAKAAYWLQKAAEQGYVASMNNLGFLYQQGLGVEKNLREAVRWYRVAAEKGEAKAQANLGLMYQDGAGVESDLVEAYKWFMLSAEQGDVVGKHFFDDYNEHQRLNGAQLAKAQQMAADFRRATSPVRRD
jgi:TPR repeat protein